MGGVGGIVDAQNNFIESTGIATGTGDAYTPTEEIQTSPETVIYFGLIHSTWGHTISDCIRRLWFFKSNTYKKYFRNCKIFYDVMEMFGKKQLLENFVELLKIFDIDINKMQPVTKPVKFKNIILPDESFFHDKQIYFSNEYLETVEQIRNFALKNKTPVDNKKLFLYYGRKTLNEQRLAKYFQEKGYAVIVPENIPLAAQLNLYINCESFASTVGSCSHNMIFTPTNSEVILIPRAFFLNGYQPVFDQMHERKIIYIDSTLSLFASDNWGPFFYILSKQLKEFFGETWNGEYTAQDFEEFLMHTLLANKNGKRQLYPDAVKYYDKVFFDFISQLKKRPDLMKKYNVVFQ